MNYSSGPSANSPSSKNMVTGTIAWIVIILCTITLFISSRTDKPADATESDLLKVSDQFSLSASSLMGTRSLSPASVPPQTVDDQLKKLAKTDGEQIARAIVLREMGEKETSETILKEIEVKGKEQKRIVDATRRLFKGEDSGEFNSDLEQVHKKIGWFADVATAQSRDKSDMLRQRFESKNRRIAGANVALFFVLVGAGVIGLALLIIGIVMYSKGKLTFAGIGDPTPSAPFVEAFALYFALLTAMNVVIMQGWLFEDSSSSIVVTLGATMMFVVAATYWTKLRGVSQETMREAYGTHPGRGAAKEILMGIAGYLALLPILLIGFLLALFLNKVTGATPTHPIQDMVSGKTEMVALAFFLGVVLAPITEELMFRGALFAHLRKWMPWGAAAAVVGIIFALVHPQGIVGVPAIACIGFNLAVIRFWRGSTIANITAHALNNAAALSFLTLISQ